jgi:hypothetical protein
MKSHRHLFVRNVSWTGNHPVSSQPFWAPRQTPAPLVTMSPEPARPMKMAKSKMAKAKPAKARAKRVPAKRKPAKRKSTTKARPARRARATKRTVARKKRARR